MTKPTCRIKPEGNFDAFELELVEADGEPDFWELRDPEGKLPLDAFDTINEELLEDTDSGRVHSEETDQHYAWEVLDPDATGL